MTKNNKKSCNMSGSPSGCASYCLGFIGAAIYFISKAVGFWASILGVLKAMVWPAYLIYGLLKFLGL